MFQILVSKLLSPILFVAMSITALPQPDSPNWVSSNLPSDHNHYVEPMEVYGEHPIERLHALIEGAPRTEIVEASDRALHATYTSRLFGFVDDLYAELSEEGDLLHLYSASRSGYYDFGVNRRRVESLRAQWTHSGSDSTRK